MVFLPLALLLSILLVCSRAYYLPGVSPNAFKDGDTVSFRYYFFVIGIHYYLDNRKIFY